MLETCPVLEETEKGIEFDDLGKVHCKREFADITSVNPKWKRFGEWVYCTDSLNP